MIPQYNHLDFKHNRNNLDDRQTSYTWKLRPNEMSIRGKIKTENEAVRQMVYKWINTERGKFTIYPTWGLQKSDLFGKPKVFAYNKLVHRIKEGLERDDRIKRVDSFFYDKEKSKMRDLSMGFTIHTLTGSLEIREVIKIGD